MKIRNGFVSNSSSSSFCIVGYDIDDLKKLVKPEYKDEVISEGFNEWLDKVCHYGITYGYDNYGCVTGSDIYNMDDGDTLGQFKEKIRSMYEKWFDNLPLPEILLDGGFDG